MIETVGTAFVCSQWKCQKCASVQNWDEKKKTIKIKCAIGSRLMNDKERQCIPYEC